MVGALASPVERFVNPRIRNQTIIGQAGLADPVIRRGRILVGRERELWVRLIDLRSRNPYAK